MAQIKDIILRLPDKTVAVDCLKIKDLKTMQIKRALCENKESEFNWWFEAVLENLYPGLTPYEREFVFIHAYNLGYGTNSHSGLTTCPHCNGDARIALVIKPGSELKNFEAIINDPETGRPYIKLILELPDTPGKMVKNPEYFYMLNSEYTPDEFLEYEIQPCSTDIVVDAAGNKSNWSSLLSDSEIVKLIRPEHGPINIMELSDEQKKEVKNYLYNFQTLERIKDKSNYPINANLYIKCECGYEFTEKKGRAVDIVKISMSPELDGLYRSLVYQALIFAEQGYLTISEIDNMSRTEFLAAAGAIKKIKEAQK